MTKISEEQRENLNKLADYLLALPEDYVHFGMQDFCKIRAEDDFEEDTHIEPTEASAKEFPCGTVACAVGHAINAGIENKLKYSDWSSYSTKYLVDFLSEEWDWCFSGGWAYTDDTPQGAGKRIKYLLENGLPDDAHFQRHGDSELCY